MELSKKEQSRQKQLWFSFVLVAFISISTLVLVFFDKDVSGATVIISTAILAVMAKESVNLATSPDRDFRS